VRLTRCLLVQGASLHGSMTSARHIPISVPHMSGQEEIYVREAFNTNWLSTVGPHLTAFEAEFEAFAGMPSVALSSGTAALHLGLRLLDVVPGDTVVCSTLTFVASANPIRYLGAEPVFVDSERQTWNMDPTLLAKALSAQATLGRLPKAVVIVDLYGQPADMDSIRAVCQPYGVPIIEDAAEALGAQYKGRPVGQCADIAVFSFNGNKIITTTGGGMLCCHDRTWANTARFWSQQARDTGASYEHSQLGYNYRMSNVLAGIGRGQLKVLSERVRQRRAIAFRYRDAFADLRGIELMPQGSDGIHTNWLSCFLIDTHLLGISRDALIEALYAANIESRPVWKPMHLQPLYAGCRYYGGEVAEDLFRRGICLPSSSSLTEEDQLSVVNVIRMSAGASPLRGFAAANGTQDKTSNSLATQ
jgi:pyridoxal phosphate-dependent aminotransferase EpsN